jgi:hypothetical protein
MKSTPAALRPCRLHRKINAFSTFCDSLLLHSMGSVYS